jgi:ribosomal-protein-alanine N-acetyltransferase
MKNDILFSQIPYLESDKIVLRKIEKADIDEFYAIVSSENSYIYCPGKTTKTREAAENIIGHLERDYNKKKGIKWGICAKENVNKIVGTVEAFDFNEKVNMVTIGYMLHKDFWGKGIASKAVRILVEFLFYDANFNRIQAYVMPENIRSQNVLSRNKFIKEGTIRQGTLWTGHGIVDLDLYSILKSDIEKS